MVNGVLGFWGFGVLGEVQFYSNYHSFRYVKDATIVRVKNPVTDNLLRTLNARFADICVNGGQFRASGPSRKKKTSPS